jgi:hypothetical protein
MFKRKITTIILPLILLSAVISCKAIYSEMSGMNKTYTFKNKSDYTTFFSSKYHYDKQKIFFVNKDQYWDFFEYISKEKSSYFYGITLNDSLKIEDSFLNENKSCLGRISKIINSTNTVYETKSSKISSFEFINTENRKIDFNIGKSIIFLISPKLGSGINKDIYKLTKEIKNRNSLQTNYYFICIDTPYTYNN